ncbi:PilZ domain-containing protein [bacterium]|nr:PilZ domain-containing protein [bacterium]
MDENFNINECERRREPRSDKDFSLQLSDSDVVAEAIDITTSGLSCLLNKQLPELSEMKIEFLLPEREDESSISCSGVVVRSTPARRKSDRGRKRFVTALYFLDIDDAAKKKISDFTKQ